MGSIKDFLHNNDDNNEDDLATIIARYFFFETDELKMEAYKSAMRIF